MNKHELKKFIEDLLLAWEMRDDEKIASLYDKKLVAHMDNNIASYDDIINRLNFSKEHLNDVKNKIIDLVIDEDGKIAARIEQTCTTKADNKTHVFNILSIFHILNNKVIEMWATFF